MDDDEYLWWQARALGSDRALQRIRRLMWAAIEHDDPPDTSIWARLQGYYDGAANALSRIGREGGKRRPEVPWHERALELAIKIRAKHPTISRAKLGEKILNDWADEKTGWMCAPSVNRLDLFLKECEGDSRLARKHMPSA